MPDAVLGTRETIESKDGHSHCCYGSWMLLGGYIGIIFTYV